MKPGVLLLQDKEILRANAQKNRAKCKNSGHDQKLNQSLFSICNEELTSFQRFRGFFIKMTAGVSNYRRKMIFAKNSRIISINWHSRSSLCVSSKAYIIGIKGTNLKEGVFNT